MQIKREDLTKEYSNIFFHFDFSQRMELEYDHKIYELTDHTQLPELIEHSKAKGDYQISKIANNILAVYETEHQMETYSHTPVMIHMELSSFCDCECMMCKHCYAVSYTHLTLPTT